jgi:hypothetical protein
VRRRGSTYLGAHERALAADEILLRRMAGASIAELCAAFRCSRATVFRRLAASRRAGRVEAAREKAMEQVLLKAIDVYEVALDEGSETVARDVLFGLGLLEESHSSRKREP